MVARVAHFWRMSTFEVWALPLSSYVGLRTDYLDIVIPKDEDGEPIGDLSLTRLDELADKGVTDIDYDRVLAKRRKAVRHGR